MILIRYNTYKFLDIIKTILVYIYNTNLHLYNVTHMDKVNQIYHKTLIKTLNEPNKKGFYCVE